MAKVTEGLYEEDGEQWRWSIERKNEEASFELRFCIKEPYTGTMRLTVFLDERLGEEARSISLDEEHIEDAIAGLQEALRRVRGEV